MRILSATEVIKALPMAECIQAVKAGYIALVEGRADSPLRTRISIPRQEGLSLFMPAYIGDEQGDALTIKIVSLFPRNPSRNLAYIQASVIVLDPETGKTLAFLEGSSLTAIRTGAGSGVATELLAREDSHIAAIFGAGVQARTQLEAISVVRDITQVWVFDPDQNKSMQFVQDLTGKKSVPKDIRIANSPFEAVNTADIICCATTAQSPVFSDQFLKPGVHINAIGSFSPLIQEIPSETIARALVVVDSKKAVLAESGDLIIPINNHIIDQDHIHAEIGEIALGTKAGRSTSNQITCFKSVGLAVQDAMAAKVAFQYAEEMELGISIEI